MSQVIRARGVRLGGRPLPTFMAGALLLGVSACGLTEQQREAVAEFGRAGAGLGAITASEIVASRETVISLNTRYMALKPGENPGSMDGALTPEAVQARVKAARTAQTYAELLQALVDESQTEQLNAAAGQFTSSVRALDQDQRALTDPQLNALGTIVAGIGGLWVEYKKAQALKQIVPQADAQVATIGNLLAEEFAAPSGVWPSHIDTYASDVLLFAGDVLSSQSSSTSDRQIAAEAKKFGLETQQRVNTVLPDVSTAATQMVMAHTQLVEALRSDTLSLADINAFAKSVNELAAAVAVFGS